MNIQRNVNGTIINADNLKIDDVVNQRVLCLACGKYEFKRWPSGWVAHSAFVCEFVPGETPTKRKEAFKTRYRHLFR
jgi:hypothetical protein